MNERLKQLAKQAGAGEWGDSVIPAMMNIEKFAELIVQECIGYLNTEANRLKKLAESEHRTEFKEDFFSCADKCLDNIRGLKEHFGVE